MYQNNRPIIVKFISQKCIGSISNERFVADVIENIAIDNTGKHWRFTTELRVFNDDRKETFERHDYRQTFAPPTLTIEDKEI